VADRDDYTSFLLRKCERGYAVQGAPKLPAWRARADRKLGRCHRDCALVRWGQGRRDGVGGGGGWAELLGAAPAAGPPLPRSLSGLGAQLGQQLLLALGGDALHVWKGKEAADSRQPGCGSRAAERPRARQSRRFWVWGGCGKTPRSSASQSRRTIFLVPSML
jgi:hypothetical protein